MKIKEGNKLIMKDGEHTIKDFIILHNPFTLVPKVYLITNDGIKFYCEKFITKDGECTVDVAEELINPLSLERKIAVRTKEGKVYQQKELIGVETNNEIIFGTKGKIN